MRQTGFLGEVGSGLCSQSQWLGSLQLIHCLKFAFCSLVHYILKSLITSNTVVLDLDLNAVWILSEKCILPKERVHRQLQFKKGLDRQSIAGSGRLFLFQNSCCCLDLMFDGQGLVIFCLPVFLVSDSSYEIILQRGFYKEDVVPRKRMILWFLTKS